ncbi:MAG: hypothetical protein HN849_13030, partial [Victivallales bacterium]|nr:hypothetical protein [Victivallales bacterium]
MLRSACLLTRTFRIACHATRSSLALTQPPRRRLALLGRLVVCLFGICGLCAVGGTTVDIGTDYASYRVPLGVDNRQQRTQVLVFSSELGGATTINSLALNVHLAPGRTLEDWTIRVKHTAKTTYTGGGAFEATGWTNVYRQDTTVTGTGWQTFTFTTPFAYDGGSNILVDLSHNNSATASYGECRIGLATSPYRVLHTTATGLQPDPQTWSSTVGPPASAFPYLPLLRLGLGAAGGGETEIDIGTDNGFHNVPFYTGFRQSRMQVLVLASEMSGAGSINSLALNVYVQPGGTLQNWTIRMMHTARTNYNAGGAFDAAGWTTVHPSSDVTVAGTGWQTFTFTTPFAYDGTSNILVDFSRNNAGISTDGCCRTALSDDPIRLIGAVGDGTQPDPLTWTTGIGTAAAGLQVFPIMRLGVGPVGGGGTETEVAIGTGTYAWNYPMYTYYHDSRTQSIYLASEIGTSGQITALSLNVQTIPGQVMANWTIRMKHTALTAYTASTFDSSGWTTVYQTSEPRGATGWRTFTFTTPFDYDDSSNLMVDFSHNNTGYTTQGKCYATAPGGNRSVIGCSDSSASYPDPLAWSGTSPGIRSVDTYVPNIKLAILSGGGGGDPAPTVTGIAPGTGANSGSVSITNLAGTGFLAGASVKLVKTGETDIAATSVAVASASQITCTFDLTSAAVGDWDVVVTNSDAQSGTLAAGFTVTAGGGGGISYTEDFESGLGDWTNVTDGSDDFDWTRLGSSTGSSGTGPSSGADGSTYYVYTEASNPNYPSKKAFLRATFDFSSLSTVQMDFMYHMYGAAMGTLELYSNDGTLLNRLTLSGDKGNAWQQASVNLNSLAGKSSVILEFRGTTGTNFTSDMAIDSIEITGTADATPPTVTDRDPAPGATIISGPFNVDVTFSEAVQGVDASDLVLSGSAAGAATVGTPTNPSGNTWRFPISGVSNGALDISLAPDANDIADEVGNDLANVTWSYTVDAPPGTPDLVAAYDSGVSNTDDETNRNNGSTGVLQFTVSGTIAGETVTLYVGALVLGTAVAPGASTTITSTDDGSLVLFPGSYNITAKQTLPGGGTSGPSGALSV